MRNPKKFAKKVILDFLEKPEQDRTPIRVFKSGETFDATEFPPGTVIGFGREQIATAKDLPYYSGRSWGVVVSYEEDGEIKRRVIRYNANLIGMNAESGIRPLLGVYGSYQSPQIKVGEVKHGLSGFMSRVTNLAVYEVGKGIKQEEPKRSLLPGFGVLFPRLRPNRA